jgi:hypothetical protein
VAFFCPPQTKKDPKFKFLEVSVINYTKCNKNLTSSQKKSSGSMLSNGSIAGITVVCEVCCEGVELECGSEWPRNSLLS